MHPYLVNHSEPRPERIRPIPDAFYRNAADMTFREMAYVILDVILGDEIRPDRLKNLLTVPCPTTIRFHRNRKLTSWPRYVQNSTGTRN